MNSAEHDLYTMGYRRLADSKLWGKPFGYSLFTFDLDRQEWAHWFKGHSCQTTMLMDTKLYDGLVGEGSLVAFIASVETYHHLITSDRHIWNFQ